MSDWAHAQAGPGSTKRQTGIVVPFHWPGPLSDTDVSDIYRHPLGKPLLYVTFSLTVPGITPTTLEVRRNEVVIGTVVIDADKNYGETDFWHPFERHDRMQVATPIVGDGAEGATVNAVFGQ